MDAAGNESSSNDLISNITSDGLDLCYLKNDEQCKTINTIRIVVSSLALVGCVFIICSLFLLGLHTHFANRLLLYLTVCGIMQSVCYLSKDSQGSTCEALGWLLYYSGLATWFWICCITFNIYMNAVKMKQTVQHEKKYHVISWGIPLVVSFVLLAVGAYGPAGGGCWMSDKEELRFGMWYGPLIFTILILFLVYPYIIWKVYKLEESGNLDQIKKRRMTFLKDDVKPLIAYPIVYLLVSIFPLIHRIQNSISTDTVYALVILHALCSPLQSALNAIVHALSQDILSKLRPHRIKMVIENLFRNERPLITDTTLDSTAENVPNQPTYIDLPMNGFNYI